MATIELPASVGVNVVGARPAKPHVFTPGLSGRVRPLSLGEGFLVGSVELIDLGQITTDGLSNVLSFLMELEGPLNTFELPLPQALMPWAAEEGTPAATASAGGTGEVTVSALPNPAPVDRTWVRVGDRCVFIQSRSGNVLTVRPRLEFPAGVGVQWGRQTVMALMEGEPSNLAYDSRTGFVNRVTVNWREAV